MPRCLKRKPTTRRLLVASPRNSECGSAKLSELDWSRWFADTSFGMFYLHVYHLHDDSIHLAFEGGELFWLVP